MNIGTYLYLIILFVVFSPGILFSVPSPNSKSKWVRVFTHGFLFSVAWLLTHRTVNNILNSVKEGAQTLDTTNIGGTDVAISSASTAVIIPQLRKPDVTTSTPQDSFYENFSGVEGHQKFNGGKTMYLISSDKTRQLSFTTRSNKWTYNTTTPNGYALNIFYRGSPESPYFFGNKDASLTDSAAWSVFLQGSASTSSISISAPFDLIASGTWLVEFAIMQSQRRSNNYRSLSYFESYMNIKVSFGSSYIHFLFDNSGKYTTEQDGGVTIKQGGMNNIKGGLSFVTLAFNNMNSGINILSFEATSPGDGFMISQIRIT